METYLRWAGPEQAPDMIAMIEMMKTKRDFTRQHERLLKRLLTVAPEAFENWIRGKPYDRGFYMLLHRDLYAMTSGADELSAKAKEALDVLEGRLQVNSPSAAVEAAKSSDAKRRGQGIKYASEHRPTAPADLAMIHDALKAMAKDQKESQGQQALETFLDDYATAADSADMVAIANREFYAAGNYQKVLAALFRTDGAAARGLITRHLADGAYRSCAIDIIRKLDPSLEKEVWPLLSCGNADFTQSLINVLGEIGTPQSIAPIQAAYDRRRTARR